MQTAAEVHVDFAQQPAGALHPRVSSGPPAFSDRCPVSSIQTRALPSGNLPMLRGQAFNGLKRAHWACAPGEVRHPLRVPPAISDQKVSQVIRCSTEKPSRKPMTGPTTADMRTAALDPAARQVVSRPWTQVWRNSVNGRTSIGLKCPFCNEVVQAFVWSLPNGKRCYCGAFHGRLQSTHWIDHECAQ